MANVLLKNIRKSYDGRNDVLADISLDISDGEFVVLVGPSGCGKSTLLRMLSGLESITDGELRIGDRIANDLPPAQRGIAMVFQSYALYPHMTVYRNIAFGLRVAGLPRAAVESRVHQAAQTLKIEHLLERYPRELSGGQRQRVAIGRAIVRQPELFLFDEPLSNLDAALRNETRLEIARLHKKLGATIVYVTHDQVEAMTLGDKIVVMHGGRIQQAGTPLELYHAPANQFVASFIGSPKMNLMPAVLHAVDDSQVTVGLQNGHLLHFDLPGVRAYPGQAVTLGIRPEHMSLQPVPGPMLGGTVNLIEHLGEADHVHLTLANGTDVVMRSSPEDTPEIGEQVRVHMRHDAVHLFSDDGLALGRRHIPERRNRHQAIAA